MRTLRILVVDDQEHMRELLEALSADGHGVDAAENGMAALKLFEAQPYDLVVSDLQMPQMDGPKLYGELQKRRPEGMPGFVFITGEDEAPEYRKFLQDSKLPVVTKPFTFEGSRRMRSAESWIGVSGFLISCATWRAISPHARTRCARASSSSPASA